MDTPTATIHTKTSPKPPRPRRLRHLVDLHDLIFSDENKTALKQAVIRLSIAGFVAHLALISVARWLNSPLMLNLIGDDYLSAISTPFNIILFYEVLTLIGTLHVSTTQSIANQFEIVSLIFIRDSFVDISSGRAILPTHSFTPPPLPLYADMGAGLFMYFTVGVFRHIAQHQRGLPSEEGSAAARARFTAQKKVIAVALTLVLLGMAAYNVALFALDAWRRLHGGHPRPDPVTTFYHDLFTVMIFTDVLVLILSLVVTGRYENVFRNAAFVVSIILIRVALTEQFPSRAPLAVLGMVFGVVTLLVYNYHNRLNDSHRG